MAPQQPVWKICLGQLGPNLQEAAELANVLQEVSASIQVTGLTRALTARTSTSSGNPTHLSAKERIKRAVPLDIGAGRVPWGQLVAIVSSTALQEPNSPASNKQPQVLEVNSGGAVYFLFFQLKPGTSSQLAQQDAWQQALQQHHQQQVAAGKQDSCVEPGKDQGQAGTDQTGHALEQQQQGQPPTAIAQDPPKQDVQQQSRSESTCTLLATACEGYCQLVPHQPAVEQQQQGENMCSVATPAGIVAAENSLSAQHSQHLQQPQQQQQPPLPLLQLHGQRAAPQEGVVVLKVGASRLAMQAELFANELTRHLGIAAPDCRIVRQVGSSAAEWSAVLAAVQQLAEPQPAPAVPTPASLSSRSTAGTGASSKASAPHNSSGGGSSSSAASSASSGCQTAAELLAELSHLPCCLLMEFVEGSKLSDCPQALDPAVATVGQLCEDVGRLFLLDMLLGNADRMSCPELGWRGNVNNLLYAMPGSRHAGRAVAIDSCVARRPPALKASAEDAAVERLSQLVLAVPGASSALLRQLLGALRKKQLRQQLQQVQRRQQSLPGAVGLATQLSMDSFAGQSGASVQTSSSGQAVPTSSAAQQPATGVGAGQAERAVGCSAVDRQASGSQLTLPLPPPVDSRSCKTSLGGLTVQSEDDDGCVVFTDEACFTEEEVAHFQAGLRQCLDGVLQIKGLLEMVSAKIAEWIAEFVEDVVRLNPALLPNPASPGPGTMLRSPRPSPRPSGRGSFTSIRLEASPHPASTNSSVGGVQDGSAVPSLGVLGSGCSNNSICSTKPHTLPPPAPAQVAAAAGPVSTGEGLSGKLRLRPAANSPEPTTQGNPLSPPAGAATAAAAPPAAAATAGSDSRTEADCKGGGPFSTPPKGLFKQLAGGAKKEKTQLPLARRFAAIKAAICSPNHHSSKGMPAQQHLLASGSPSSPAASTWDQTGSSLTPPQCAMPCSPPNTGTGGQQRNAAPSCVDVTSACGASSDLATAVAAALSPRAADAAQAGALMGLLVRRSPSGRHRSLNGALGSSSEWSEAGHAGGAATGKPPCARRVTWCAAEEPAAGVGAGVAAGGSRSGSAVLKGSGGGGASIRDATSPPAVHKGPADSPGAGSAPVADAQHVAGWSSSPASAAAASAPVAKAQPQANINSSSNGSSRNNTSSPGHCGVGGGQQALNRGASISPFAPMVGRECSSPAGLPPFSSPPPAGAMGLVGHVDSFTHRQLNTRHLSFTSGGGEAGNSSSNSPAGVAAVGLSPVPQQRSSNSSLQVLASLQLDATLASITQEARHDGALAERLAHWKTKFKERGAELSAAIAAWQQRHQLAAVLSTGFLDGSHPIVDAYELGVRLQHMLRRLTALAAGALVQVPITVLPEVFLGNAVAADSHHLLQYLGVTHVLNAAQELQLTPDPGMFHVLRVPIRDEEEEDVAGHFNMAQSWIDAALSSGGAVLVHCHEGKSRSVAMLLAYLMISRGLTLAAALQHMRGVHPKASPNAGFMAQLVRLDQQLHGTCSIQPSDLPRSKPEARICSICGAAAGISYASLVRHTKAKHGLAKPPRPPSPAGAAVAVGLGQAKRT